MNKTIAFAKNARVEVRVRNGANAFMWKPGRVKELNKNGAFIELDEGNDNFFFAKDIRPYESQHRPRDRAAFATFGDILKVPPLPPLPPPEPPRAPPPPPVEKPAPAPETSKKEEPQVKSQPKQEPPKSPTLPPPAHATDKPPTANGTALPLRVRSHRSLTEVGERLARVRQVHGRTQAQLAALTKTTIATVASIEQGIELPGDDYLLAVADSCERCDLDDLLEARQRDRERAGEKAPEPRPALAPATSPPALPPAAPKGEPAPAPAKGEEPRALTLEQFCDQLAAVAPEPTARAQRMRWFELAKELFQMGRAS